MTPSDYEFLDCGNSRRLERLGGVVVSRPAPAAANRPGLGAAAWRQASLRFERDGGWQGTAPEDWTVRFDGVTLRLRPAAAGQIGVFPEHARVAGMVLDYLCGAVPDGDSCQVLNLFAHTGLATLRLTTRPGATVAHVDAAAAAVRTAKENAELSGLADRPVRWLVDDALTFCRKELRRGNRYQTILADPPAFGRSGKGKEWKLERDFPELVTTLTELVVPGGRIFLTCHREGWTKEAVGELLAQICGRKAAVRVEDLFLQSAVAKTTLRAGIVAQVF